MSARDAVARRREVALVDLVDRLLAGGVVIGGDLTLSIADVDLVRVGLHAIVASVATVEGPGAAASSRAGEGAR
jgi:gas vesicle protein GvpA/GvpJ/GvpM family